MTSSDHLGAHGADGQFSFKTGAIAILPTLQSDVPSAHTLVSEDNLVGSAAPSPSQVVAGRRTSSHSATTSFTTTSRERPILFGGEMVRALLDGRKAQTRRVVTPQPPSGYDRVEPEPPGYGFRWENDSPPFKRDELGMWTKRCPYGQPGDRLWVRETWADKANGVRYRADFHEHADTRIVFKSPIFMPRRASRLTLEITDVRVERVQSISEADAIAEGVEGEPGAWKSYEIILEGPHAGKPHPHAIVPNAAATTSYRELWDSLNAKRGYSWESNPWVWVLTFRRIDA